MVMTLKQDFFDIIEQFKQATKKTEKEELLTRCIHNEDLVRVLHLLNDKRIATNIGLRKLEKIRQELNEGRYTPEEVGVHFPKFGNLLDFITSEDCTGSNEDVASIVRYIDKVSQTPTQQQVLDEIVAKKLKIGVQAKAINKVFSAYGDLPLIYENVLMKGEDYRKNRPNLKGNRYALSLKEDGYRVKIIKQQGKVKVYSTSGKEYTGLTEIVKAFEEGNYEEGKVFEGEIIKKNEEAEKNLQKLALLPNATADMSHLTYVNSYERFRETSTIMLANGEKLGVEVYLFDVTDYDKHILGYDPTPYAERRAYLESDKVEKNEFIKITQIIEQGEHYDEQYIQTCLANLLTKGYEGLMLHDLNAPFEGKRTRTIFKLKGSLTGDGVVEGVYEGEGENVGKLGGVIVTYKQGTIRVGSGFSAKEREEYYQHPEKIIGKVVSYQYTEPSQDREGNYSTRYARWLHIREDKTPSEVNYDV